MATAKPARLPVDWEKVAKEYRLGKYSVRELARRHSVGHQSILRRVAKEGWTQDKAPEVNRRVAERLLLSAPHRGAQPRRTGRRTARTAAMGTRPMVRPAVRTSHASRSRPKMLRP